MPMMIASKKVLAAGAASVMLVVTGCAGSYGAGEVTSAGVGEAATVRQGTVVSVRSVRIQPDQNYLGAATGAVIGGVIGSQIGGGSEERTVGGVVGAVGGGIAGNEIAKAANTRPGYAYVIDFGDGDLKEITQGADVYIEPGRVVNVAFYSDRVRVSPAY